MLYVLLAVKRRKKTGAVLQQEPDTRRRGPVPAIPGNIEVIKLQDPKCSHHRATRHLPQSRRFSGPLPRERARTRASRELPKEEPWTLE